MCIYEIINSKPIFALLFFEHGYLAKYLDPIDKILVRCSYHSPRGNRVLDFLFRPWFLFYVKKRVTFGHFLQLYFVCFIK